jgi:hypothetical protein
MHDLRRTSPFSNKLSGDNKHTSEVLNMSAVEDILAKIEELKKAISKSKIKRNIKVRMCLQAIDGE